MDFTFLHLIQYRGSIIINFIKYMEQSMPENNQIQRSRKQDIVLNLMKQLKNSFLKQLKKNKDTALVNHFTFERNSLPQRWTAITQLFYVFLKYSYSSKSERQSFRNMITSLLDKKLKKVKKGQDQSTRYYRTQLLKILKEIALQVLDKETMPQAHQIKQILTKLLCYNGKHKLNVSKQAKYIQEGLNYILSNFPCYHQKRSNQHIQKDEIPDMQEQNQQTSFFPDILVYQNYKNKISMQNLQQAKFSYKKQDLLEYLLSADYYPESPEKSEPFEQYQQTNSLPDILLNQNYEDMTIVQEFSFAKFQQKNQDLRYILASADYKPESSEERTPQFPIKLMPVTKQYGDPISSLFTEHNS